MLPCVGAVVVSTPQDVALIDVRKGVAMFRKLGIPVSQDPPSPRLPRKVNSRTSLGYCRYWARF